MEDWKQMVRDGEEKDAAALLQAIQTKGELGKIVEKQNELEGRLTKIEGETGCLIIRFNTMFVKPARTDKVLRSVTTQLACDFDGIVNRLGGDPVISSRIGLEYAYCDNMEEFPVAWIPISGSGPASISWQLDREGEVKGDLFASKRDCTCGKTAGYQSGGKYWGCCWFTLSNEVCFSLLVFLQS